MQNMQCSYLFQAFLHVPLPQYKEAVTSFECGNNAKLWHRPFINHLYLQTEKTQKTTKQTTKATVREPLAAGNSAG